MNCSFIASKTPILIFTGDQRGIITKWERMEINQYLYTKEFLKVGEREKQEKVKRRPGAESAVASALMEKNKSNENGDIDHQESKQPEAPPQRKKTAIGERKRSDSTIPTVPPKPKEPSPDEYSPKTSISDLVYIEELDYIIAACEDKNICKLF